MLVHISTRSLPAEDLGMGSPETVGTEHFSLLVAVPAYDR
jgi:hypothetical protein